MSVCARVSVRASMRVSVSVSGCIAYLFALDTYMKLAAKTHASLHTFLYLQALPASSVACAAESIYARVCVCVYA